MKKRGLWGGVIAANSICVAEIIAISQVFSGFANMSWENLLVLIIVMLIQLVVAIVIGKSVDTKRMKRMLRSELKTRAFATEVFASLAAMATRDNSHLTVYLLAVYNFEEISRKLAEEEVSRIVQLIENGISSTIRKGDIFVKWDDYRYVIIASDRGVKSSTIIQRIQRKLDELTATEMFKVPIVYGTSSYPIEGNELEQLVDIAYERLYPERGGLS